MIRFKQLEDLGLSVAAMTAHADGDCCEPGPGTPRAACLQALGLAPDALTCGRQVHGTSIGVVTEAERGRGALSWDAAFPATDGLLTDVPGLPLAVFVADCVPLFLYAPDARVAGLVHAGREGTRASIATAAITTLCYAFAVSPREVHALIGPSAGPERYEVSESLAAEWEQAGLPRRERKLDLWQANRIQLEAAGVPGRQIFCAGMCTIGDERFFSFRRGDETARNMALVMI